MADMESLSPDQRAVLQLVLQRGRSFDEIAQMLAIDRAAVRNRALAALDALGPATALAPERRGLITDYLLGQLPGRVAEIVREQLAASPADRAWARALAAELAPLARTALPEIPDGAQSDAIAPRSSSESQSEPSEQEPWPAEPLSTPSELEFSATESASSRPRSRPSQPRAPDPGYGRPDPPRPRSSRLGGAILIAVGALVAVAAVVVVVVLVSSSGSTSTGSSRVAVKQKTTTSPRTATAPTTTGGGGAVTPLAQIKLTSPAGGRQSGVAEIVRQSGRLAIVIEARNVPANSGHDAYAVWLSNGAGRYDRLGFVNPPVKSNGVLQTAGGLPSDVASYDELVISLETTRNPTAPSRQVVLEGSFKLSG